MKLAVGAVFLGLLHVLLALESRALAWRYDYKPPVVGTVIVYDNNWVEVLLSRRGDLETWCTVLDGRRIIDEGDFEVWRSSSNSFDGKPVAFIEDLTRTEFLSTYWPLTPGKTASSTGFLLHSLYPTRYSEKMKVVAHLPAAVFGGHREDAVLVETRMQYERESINGIRSLFYDYYVPRWRVWLIHSWQFVSSTGETSTSTVKLKNIYVPSIVGKPIPLPEQCLQPVG